MFESIVTDIIVKYIGEYIKNLSSEQLKINIFSGNVVLKNLEIKGEALQSFKLPLHVQKGIIGNLELKIPWTNIKSQPVILEIDSICLYAVPQTGFHYDEEEEKRKLQELKQKKLEKYELIRAFKEGGVGGELKNQKQDTFMSSIMSKVLNNIQVKIKSFHLRYEEIKQNKVYSLGVSFGSLIAHTKENNNSSSSSNTTGKQNSETLYKYVELMDFSIYLNSDDSTVSTVVDDTALFQSRMKEMIGTHQEEGSHSYILRPITVTLDLEVNKNLSMDINVPKMRVRCNFEEVSFVIEENQYQTILKLLTTISNYAQEIKYLKYRPKVRPKQDPRAWWKYVGDVLRESIRAKIQQRSWAFIQKRRQNRKEYIVLFKKLQGVEWLDAINEKEKDRLKEMEGFLSFEDIIYFRSLARRELAMETQIADQKKGEFYSTVNRSSKSWYSSYTFWGGANTASAQPKLSIQLSKEQQDEIVKSMEYEDIATSIEMPAHYVQHIFEVQVDAILFTIIGNRPGENPLLKSYLSNISFKFSQRPQGFKLEMDLESFNVLDHYNKKTLFPYIITSTPRYKRISSSTTTPSVSSNSNLFHIIFESNPINSSYDYSLSLLLNSLEVIVNKPQIERLIEFATPKENVNLFSLSSAALEEFLLLKEMTIFQLREVVNHHKTIDLLIDAKAPIVIIPEYADRKNTNLIILDLGNFTMQSDINKVPINKSKKSIDLPFNVTDQITTLNERREETSADLKISDLYDHYRASLSSIQIHLSQFDKEWYIPDSSFHLIDEMSINLHIQSCIEPNELSLALFKVSGQLPAVNMNISDEVFLQLYHMAKTLTSGSNQTVTVYNSIMDTIYTQQSDPEIIEVNASEIKLSETYKKVLMKRKLFEGDFRVDSVTMDIYSQTSALIQLRIADLNLSVKKRTFDFTGSLELGSLEFNDCQDSLGTPSTKSLITSQSRKSQNKTLISITHEMVDKESPSYENVDQLIDFNFGELNINYHPKSIGKIISFLDYCFEEVFKIQESFNPTGGALIDQSENTAQPNQISRSNAIVQSPTAKNDIIKAKANIYSLSISLNDSDQKEIGLFSINSFVVSECIINGRYLEIEGYLESIFIDSFLDSPDGFKVLTPKETGVSMATFKYSANQPGSAFDKEIELNLKSIRITVLVDFILKSKSLLMVPFNTVKYDSLTRYNKSSAATAATNTNEEDIINNIFKPIKTNYKVFLESPQIILSSSDDIDTNDDRIIAELGSVDIRTEIVQRREDSMAIDLDWEVLYANLYDMNIKTMKNSISHTVLHNLSIHNRIESVICTSADRKFVSIEQFPYQQNIHVEIQDGVRLEFEDLEHSLIYSLTQDVINRILSKPNNKNGLSTGVSSELKSSKELNGSLSSSLGFSSEQKVIQNTIDKEKNIISNLYLKLKFFQLKLLLNGNDLSEINVESLNVHQVKFPKEKKAVLSGSIGRLRICDSKSEADQFKELVRYNGPQSTPMIDFKFTNYLHPSAHLDGEWSSSVEVSVAAGIQFVGNAGLVLGLKDFFLLPFTTNLTPEQQKMDPKSILLPNLELFVYDFLTTMSKLKLSFDVPGLDIILPLSPHSPNSIILAVDRIKLSNRFLDLALADIDIPIESILIHLLSARLYFDQPSVERKQLSEPFDINIDYQAIDSVLTNTIDIMKRSDQPTVVNIDLSPLKLSLNEIDYQIFCNMLSQLFRSLDSSPKLKLKKNNPYIYDLIYRQNRADQLISRYLQEIMGMRIKCRMEQVNINMVNPGFANVILNHVDLNIDMATTPNPKKMQISGSVRELQLYDLRAERNDLILKSSDPKKNMMEFTHISYANTHRPYTSSLDFDFKNLHTLAYSSYLLRVWDCIIVTIISVFGGYQHDIYHPNPPQLPPDNSGLMKMNVNIPTPTILLPPSFDNITSDFHQLSSTLINISADKANEMRISLSDMNVLSVSQQPIFDEKLKVEIILEDKQLDGSVYTVNTSDMVFKVGGNDFSSFYNCICHQLERHYEMDRAENIQFKKPNFTPKSLDMKSIVNLNSITFNLVNSNSEVCSKLYLDQFRIDNEINAKTESMVVNGQIQSISILDPIRQKLVIHPTKLISFNYKTFNQYIKSALDSTDEYNSLFECLIQSMEILPFPLDPLLAIQTILLTPYYQRPLPTRPLPPGKTALEGKMKMDIKLLGSSIRLYNLNESQKDKYLSLGFNEFRLKNGFSIKSLDEGIDLLLHVEYMDYLIENLMIDIVIGQTKAALLGENKSIHIKQETNRTHKELIERLDLSQALQDEASSHDEDDLLLLAKTNTKLHFNSPISIDLDQSQYLFIKSLYDSMLNSINNNSLNKPRDNTPTTESNSPLTLLNLYKITFNQLFIKLRKDVYPISEISLKNIIMMAQMDSDSTMKVQGVTDSLSILDTRREMVLSNFKSFVTSSENQTSKLVFNYHSKKNLLKVNLSNTSITPLFDLITDIQKYLNDSYDVVSEYKEEDQQQQLPDKLTQPLIYEIQLKSVSILLPMDYESEGHLLIELPSGRLTNELIKINGLNVFANTHRKILNQLNFTMKNQIIPQQPTESTISIEDLDLTVSQDEYLYLYDVFNQSLKRYYIFKFGPYQENPSNDNSASTSSINNSSASLASIEEILEMKYQIDIERLRMKMLTIPQSSTIAIVKEIGEVVMLGSKFTIEFTNQKMTTDGLIKDLILFSASFENHREIISSIDKSKDLISFKYISNFQIDPNIEYDNQFLIDIKSLNMFSKIGPVLKIKDFIMEPFATPIVGSPKSKPKVGSKMKQVINMEPWTLEIPDNPHTTTLNKQFKDFIDHSQQEDLVIIKFGSFCLTNFYREIDNPKSEDSPRETKTIEIEVLAITLSKLMILTKRKGLTNIVSNQTSCSLELEKLWPIRSNRYEDQRITASMPSLELYLSEDDYIFMYKVFTGNWMHFEQAIRPPIPPPIPTLVGHSLQHIALSHEEQMKISETQFKSNLGFINPSGDLWQTTYLVIQSFNLYISKTNHHEDPLALLSMNNTQVNYILYREGITKIDMILKDVTLIDKRLNTECVFKEILTRKQNDSTKQTPSIEVSYFNDPMKSRQFTSISLDHPMLFVSPNSILPIMEFFTSIQPKPDPKEKTDPNQSPPNPQVSNPNEIKSHTRLFLKVTKPKLLLVEDETQQNTNALVIKMPIEFHLSNTSELNQIMELYVTKCQVFKTTPFSETEGIITTPITNSFGFNLIYVYLNDNQQQTINIHFQSLKIFLSYKEMLMINRLLNNLHVFNDKAANGDESQPSSPQDSPMLHSSRSSRDLREPRPHHKRSLSTSVQQQSTSPPSQQQRSNPPPKLRKSTNNNTTTLKAPDRPDDSMYFMHKTRIHVDFNGRVSFTLLNESSTKQDIPFLQLSLGELTTDYWAWSEYSFISTEMLFVLDVFNQKHMAYDNVIEQFPLNIQVLQSEDPKLKISIKSNGIVNANISHPFILALANFYQNIMKKDENPQDNVNLNNNNTGTTIKINDLNIESSPNQSAQDSPIFWKKYNMNGEMIQNFSLNSSTSNSPTTTTTTTTSNTLTNTINKNKDIMKSSVNLSHLKTHNRSPSIGTPNKLHFNTVGHHQFWVVNLTGKEILYYVEELNIMPSFDVNSNDEFIGGGKRRKKIIDVNDGEQDSSKQQQPMDDDEDEGPSKPIRKREIHSLKDKEKQVLELNSNLFKTRDFRAHGQLNAHIALRFIDSEENQWIHGVSINRIGDNFYFPPFGNRANLVVCEVGWNDSNENKIATLRSPVIIKNSSTIPIEILITSDNDEEHQIGPIRSEENYYIPVDFWNMDSYISIRPYGFSYDFDKEKVLILSDSTNWSENHIFSASKKIYEISEIKEEMNPSMTLSINNTNPLQSTNKFSLDYMHLATLTQNGIRCDKTGLMTTTLLVTPPLIFENALFCDIEVKILPRPKKKLTSDEFYRYVRGKQVIGIPSGKQIPWYFNHGSDIGFALTIKGLGQDQYFPIEYPTLDLKDPKNSSIYTQEIHYHCFPKDGSPTYEMTLKLNHKIEGGCHIVSIYAPIVIVNHTMIPFILKPSHNSKPSGTAILTLQTNEQPIILTSDRFIIYHPAFNNIPSKEFDILLGKEDIIEIQLEGRDKMKYQFKVMVTTGDGVYFKTRKVDIYPRFILSNNLPVKISYTQVFKDIFTMTKESMELTTNSQIPFNWFDGREEQLLSVTIVEGDKWTWSGGIKIDQVGVCYLKLRNMHDNDIEQYIRVEILDTNKSTLINLYSIDCDSLPFHIRNDTNSVIHFNQKTSGAKKYTLNPGEDIYFTWDYPASDRLLNLQIESIMSEINLNKIKVFKPIKLSNNQLIFPSIQAFNGSTRELIFSTSYHEVKEIDQIEFALDISLEKLGFSLINDVPEELIYIHFTDFSFWTSTSNLTKTTWLLIGDFQVDNQQPDTEYPVMMWCDKKRDSKALPFLEYSAVKLNKKNFEYYDLIALYLNEIYIQLDDKTLVDIHSFYSKLPLDKFSSNSNSDVAQVPINFYIKWLIFAEIKIYLTFSISRDGYLSNYNKIPALRLLVPSLGKSLGQLENAPLVISQLGIRNIFTTNSSLYETLMSHYTKQMKRQIHILLGSSNIFGSPVVFFNNISTGMTEAIDEPIKGSILLMKRILYAAANSSTALFGAISNGFATWSMDESYLRRRDNDEKRKAKHIGDGLFLGGKGLAYGIADGVGGIVYQPIQGAMQEGIFGFLKGLGKGLAGIAVKPVTGVFDFAARTSEGIRNNTHIHPERPRYRMPRFINPREPIREYSIDESEGNFLLKTVIDKKKPKTKMEYKFHIVLPELTILITSYSLVFLKRNNEYKSMFLLADIDNVHVNEIGQLIIDLKKSRNVLFPGLGKFYGKNQFIINTNNYDISCQLQVKILYCQQAINSDEKNDDDSDKQMIVITNNNKKNKDTK